MSVWKEELSLDLLVTALCLDYTRRAGLIEGKLCSRRTDTELRYYNFKIYDASAEVVGDRFAEIFIRDIGERRGYASTELSFFSEGSYKSYKKLIKENIAKKLHLCD